MSEPKEDIGGDSNWTAGKLVGLAVVTLAVAFTIINAIANTGLR